MDQGQEFGHLTSVRRQFAKQTLSRFLGHLFHMMARFLNQGNHQSCKVFHMYRVVFLTGPPDFLYQNEKQVAANQD